MKIDPRVFPLFLFCAATCSEEGVMNRSISPTKRDGGRMSRMLNKAAFLKLPPGRARTTISILLAACSLAVAAAQTVPIEGAFGRSSPTNSGVNSGFRVWSINDPNHALYLASSSGQSPAGAGAVQGFWDNSYRFRLRTGVGQGFLFENNNEEALIDIDADNGNIWTIGSIRSESAGVNYFSGNVGLGTNTPQAKLDVRGSVIAATSDFTNGATGSFLQIQQPVGAGDTYTEIGAFSNGGHAWNNLVLQRAGGNVGIGTTSPQNKLDVNGTIRAKEVIVESANWPDYVFEKDYALPSLGEVSEHIQVHGRLPGVPSADEVAQNGVSIGESQRILLEKLEELTLYLLQFKKENSALNARVDELEKQLAHKKVEITN